MFETQESSKEQPCQKNGRVVASKNHGQDEDSIQEAIVLEMNMVDDEKPRREKNRECSGMCSYFVLGCLHVARQKSVKGNAQKGDC